MNVTETATDDPDVAFYENYACGSQRNYTAYCNSEVDKLIDKQSAESQCRKAQKDRLGDREEADRGRCPPDLVLQQDGELPPASTPTRIPQMDWVDRPKAAETRRNCRFLLSPVASVRTRPPDPA